MIGVRLWLYVQSAGPRFRRAVRAQWRRILAGALFGWVIATVFGAFGLVALERFGLIGRAVSDEFTIVLPLAGVGGGALLFYALRA